MNACASQLAFKHDCDLEYHRNDKADKVDRVLSARGFISRSYSTLLWEKSYKQCCLCGASDNIMVGHGHGALLAAGLVLQRGCACGVWGSGIVVTKE